MTQLRRLQEQGRADLLRMLIEHVEQFALALFDSGARLVYGSPRFLNLVGRQADEAVGLRWDDLGFLPGEEARQAFQQVLERKVRRRVHEVAARRPSEGETVWDCSLIPVLRGDDASVEYVVVSAVEITGPVLARHELERADRLKDEFLSLASHELRTPLVPLSTYAEVISQMLSSPDRGPEWERRMRDAVSKFQRQIAQLARLTDDLLDVARLESGRLSLERGELDLKRVVAAAVEQIRSFSEQPPIEVFLPDLPPEIPVQGDEQRLTQVLLNLLGNAARHAPDSPQVSVRLELDRAHPRARVVVSDQGPGIEPEKMGVLFTRFARDLSSSSSARSGLGLGLYISRGIVEQHGGSIRAESRPGRGTSFIVELPLSR